jgi:hypothetical protein
MHTSTTTKSTNAGLQHHGVCPWLPLTLAALTTCIQVVAVGPRSMHMYYHSYDQRKGKYVVGVATSRDGFKWEKQGPMFEVGLARCGGAWALEWPMDDVLILPAWLGGGM